MQVDDAVWNYDARYYSGVLLKRGGTYDRDCIVRKPNHKLIIPLCNNLEIMEYFSY